MRTHFRRALVAAPLTALLGAVAVPTSAGAATAPGPAGPTSAVAYQISIAHAGYSADTSITAPLSQKWSVSFGGGVSYPLIVGNKVFVTVASSGGSPGSELYALSKKTGKTIWSEPITSTRPWSNAAYDGGQVFVVNWDGEMLAYNATTGALNWSEQLPGQYSFSSPPTASQGGSTWAAPGRAALCTRSARPTARCCGPRAWRTATTAHRPSTPARCSSPTPVA